MALTRRSLKEAGFDDKQAQALVDVIGPAAERRALQADVAQLKHDVALLNERFDGLRGELVARIEASEERVKNEIVAFRAEVQNEVAGLRAEVQNEVAGLRTETRTEIAGLRTETRTEIAGLRTEMRTEFAKVHGRIDSLEGRLKLMLWFMGIGLTLYTGTTISLMILLFRNVLA